MHKTITVGLPTPPADDDASLLLRRWLREKYSAKRSVYNLEGRSAFDLGGFLADHVREACRTQIEAAQATGEHITIELDLPTNTQPFVSATWSLVRQGILSPTLARTGSSKLKLHDSQFAFTAFGIRWLEAEGSEEVLPSEHGRFAAHLDLHRARFGDVFFQRAHEALGCYHAALFLACCVMAGAAAEAIVIRLAIAKTGDEDRIRKLYWKRTGREELRRILEEQTSSDVRTSLTLYFDLLKHWRDPAAHASSRSYGEESAFLALITLLRFAQFGERSWQAIVGPAAA
jgi:hypothetical protein